MFQCERGDTHPCETENTINNQHQENDSEQVNIFNDLQ